jgi:transposase
LLEHFRELDRQVKELEREINAWHRKDTASQRLQAIPGIGPLTASALVASVGDAKVFHNGRQFARAEQTGGWGVTVSFAKLGRPWWTKRVRRFTGSTYGSAGSAR